ncbi:MAG: hypothetical protein ACF8NJ_05640, partial [Phycisphaerales bacterium JB038]
LPISPPNKDFVAISIGREYTDEFALGLKADGSIVLWGRGTYYTGDVPPPNTDFVAISAGHYHALGLKRDGSIVAWGQNDEG